MESIIATFHIDWKIIIAQAVNFGVVIAVLYFYALKPLQKLMAERSEKITKGINDAKLYEEMLSKAKKEYEDTLNKAKLEAGVVFQQAKKDAEAKRNLMLDETKNEMKAMIENGKKTLEAEKIKMVTEAKKEVAEVAVKMAEKLLEGKVNASFDQKTIKDLENI